jgi:hypothetical protein
MAGFFLVPKGKRIARLGGRKILALSRSGKLPGSRQALFNAH